MLIVLLLPLIWIEVQSNTCCPYCCRILEFAERIELAISLLSLELVIL